MSPTWILTGIRERYPFSDFISPCSLSEACFESVISTLNADRFPVRTHVPRRGPVEGPSQTQLTFVETISYTQILGLFTEALNIGGSALSLMRLVTDRLVILTFTLNTNGSVSLFFVTGQLRPLSQRLTLESSLGYRRSLRYSL